MVDDSAFMRKAISTMLEKDPEIKVIDTAKNGQECIEKVKKLDPDVITLDIEMPVMDGLTALKHIMMENPKPVIMVSSLTTEGAEATFKALELGAMDYIPKQLSKVSLEIVKIEKELIQKVKAVAKKKVKPKFFKKLEKEKPKKEEIVEVVKKLERRAVKHDIVGIGVSTGGPPTLQYILSNLPKDFPAAILIAQHMPAAFTPSFAKRLNELSPLEVKEAESFDKIKEGHVFIAPGGKHLKIKQKGGWIEVIVSEEPKDAIYKPSASILLESIAKEVGRRGLGVILTGMGSDGLEGAKLLKEKGGRVIAQSKETCVVYGMPKAVVEAGIADEIVDLQEMPTAIVKNLYI